MEGHSKRKNIKNNSSHIKKFHQSFINRIGNVIYSTATFFGKNSKSNLLKSLDKVISNCQRSNLISSEEKKDD